MAFEFVPRPYFYYSSLALWGLLSNIPVELSCYDILRVPLLLGVSVFVSVVRLTKLRGEHFNTVQETAELITPKKFF